MIFLVLLFGIGIPVIGALVARWEDKHPLSARWSAPYAKCEEVTEGFYRADVYEEPLGSFSYATGWGFNEEEALSEAWEDYYRKKQSRKEAEEWNKVKPPATYHAKPKP